MLRPLRSRLASGSWWASWGLPWHSWCRGRRRPTPTMSHLHPCLPDIPGARRRTISSSKVTPSAPGQPHLFAVSKRYFRRGDVSQPLRLRLDLRTAGDLVHDHERQVITHFLSPNPDEGTVHARRGSTPVTLAPSGPWQTLSSSDPAFVVPDAISWLLLEVVGAEHGPKGGEGSQGLRLSSG